MLLLACVGALVLAALIRTEDANAACGFWHTDPGPHYTGPLPAGIFCDYSGDPEFTWTVPREATTARFSVFGADDPGSEAAGGHVDAKVELTPGPEITLKVGGEGGASSVRLGEEPLIVAGGGDGVEPNFVAPSAFEVETEEPGAPKGEPWSDGSINVEWTYWFEGEDLPTEPPVPPVPPRLQDPQPTPCVVPRLKGLRPAAARKALSAAHCALGQLSRRPARRRRWGRIVRQTRAAGAILPSGAAVGVVVGRRP